MAPEPPSVTALVSAQQGLRVQGKVPVQVLSHKVRGVK